MRRKRIQLHDERVAEVVAELGARHLVRGRTLTRADEGFIGQFLATEECAAAERHGKEGAHHRLDGVVVLVTLQRKGVQRATARTLEAKDAAPVQHCSTRGRAAGKVLVTRHGPREPLSTWHAEPRLQLARAREDTVALGEGDVHAMIAAPVVAERAAEAVTEVTAAEDGRIHFMDHWRTGARDVRARELDVGQAALVSRSPDSPASFSGGSGGGSCP